MQDVDILNQPLTLTRQQVEVCSYLDKLNKSYEYSSNHTIPSDAYKGALVAFKGRQGNPHWKSQVCGSLRSVFYKSLKSGGSENTEHQKYINELINFSNLSENDVKVKEKIVATILNLQKIITKIHHDFSDRTTSHDEAKRIFSAMTTLTPSIEFPNEEEVTHLLKIFEDTFYQMSVSSVNIHSAIDKFLENDIDCQKKKLINAFFTYSFDSNNYFWSKAEIKHFARLVDCGFIKQEINKIETPDSNFYYRIPVLEYLLRISHDIPDKVLDLIEGIGPEIHNNNSVYMDRIFMIIDTIGTKALVQLLPKIKKEKWLEVVGPLRRSGYNFADAVKVLSDSDTENLLKLAELLFSIKTKDEITANENIGYVKDKYFRITDIMRSDIFDALIQVKDEDILETLKLFMNVVLNINNYSEDEKTGPIKKEDQFGLYDIDLFNTNLNDIADYSSSVVISSIFVTISKLIQRSHESKANWNEVFNLIDENKFNSDAFWKLSLVAYNLDSNLEKRIIKDTLLFPFIKEKYGLLAGAEYDHFLILVFHRFKSVEQKEIIDVIIKSYKKRFEEKLDGENGMGYKHIANQIVSLVVNKIEDTKIREETEILVKDFTGMHLINPGSPVPVFSRIEGGIVNAKWTEDVSLLDIKEIPGALANRLSPKFLKEESVKNKEESFLTPKNAEGQGKNLKEDFERRRNEYIANLHLFTENKNIHSHYFWVLFSVIHQNIPLLNKKQVESVLENIEIFFSWNNGENEEKIDGELYANNTEVYKTLSDIVSTICTDKKLDFESDEENKLKLISILLILFSYNDSPDDNKNIDTQDPFSIAINSVRGRAYQAFINFINLDGKILRSESKKLFERAFEDKSYAVRFMVGHYIASIYYRDKEYFNINKDKIFNINDLDNFIATMEGCMSNVLYKDLFELMQDKYEFLLEVNPDYYTKRKYFKDIGELIGIQIALAFVHFDISIENELFKLFIKRENKLAHEQFIKFIGEKYFFQDSLDVEFIKKSLDGCLQLWKDVLEDKVKLSDSSFKYFSLWVGKKIHLENKNMLIDLIFRTLDLSGGAWDWEYGIIENFKLFASVDPEKTLRILELFYLNTNRSNINTNRRLPIFRINELKSALEDINKNKDLAESVERFVNDLIASPQGGEVFWTLKYLININIKT